MATHQLSIGLGVPDASGSVYPNIYSATIGTANDFWKHQVMVFDDTSTDLYSYGEFVVPQNYVGSAVVRVLWNADNDVTTGNVVLGFSYRVVAAGASMDQATAQESVNSGAVATAGTADFLSITSTGSPTAANFVAGRIVEWRLERLGTSANDTMAARVVVHDVVFEYADV